MRYAIVSILTLVFCELFAQTSNQTLRFDNLTIDNGLSNNTIRCILQDKKGFIWIATNNGLNKYDGYSFKQYKHVANNLTSLGDNRINTIYEDRQGVIWIGTRQGGLSVYNPKTDGFITYRQSKNQQNSINDNFILSIFEDSDNQLWIGTNSGGLNKFDRKTQTFSYYTHNPALTNGIISNCVTSIYEDAKKRLWIGTYSNYISIFDTKTQIWRNVKLCNDADCYITKVTGNNKGDVLIGTKNGLYRFDDTSSTFKLVNFKSVSIQADKLHITGIIYDTASKLWISTQENGLLYYDSKTGETLQFSVEKQNLTGINPTEIISFIKDKQGVLWIGTVWQGMGTYDKFRQQFEQYPLTKQDATTGNTNISTLCLSNNNKVWLGIHKKGIAQFNPADKTISEPQPHDQIAKLIKNNDITQIFESKKNGLWIATYTNGLFNYNLSNNKLVHYKHLATDANSLANNSVWSISEDSFGNLWIGTLGSGLELLKNDTKTFEHHQNIADSASSLNNNYIICMLHDSKKRFWIGTYGGGLTLFDKEQKRFTHFQHDNTDNYSISSNFIRVIFEDSKHNLWIGTDEAGLNKFDFDKQRFSRITTSDGLPDNTIMAIEEDNNNCLWISTYNGLSKFDYVNRTFRNLDKSDGLQSNQFSYGASLKDSAGYLYFGGINGFNRFHPDSIRDNQYLPPVYITNFSVYRKNRTKQQKQLTNYIITDDIKKIVVAHDVAVISISFVALNYFATQKNNYAYMLEGYDTDWQISNYQTKVSYTNIPAGEYVFKVKGSNSHGYWNHDGAWLQIIIKPPFWQTWWFILLMLLLLTTVVAYTYVYWVKKIRTQKKAIESQLTNNSEQIDGLHAEIAAFTEENKRQSDKINAQSSILRLAATELEKYKNKLDVLVKVRTSALQSAKERAELSDRLKTEVITDISHEIRTPLYSIIAFTNMLENTELKAEQRLRFVKRISANSQALLVFIDDITEIAKVETGEYQIAKGIVPLNAFFTSLLEYQNEQKINQKKFGVDMQLHLPVKNPNFSISTDQSLLHKTLSRIITNALKLMADGYIQFGYDINLFDNQSKNTVTENKEFDDIQDIEFFVKASGSKQPTLLIKHDGTPFEEPIKDKTNDQIANITFILTKKMILLLGGKIAHESFNQNELHLRFTLPYDKPVTYDDFTRLDSIELISAGYDFTGSTLLILESNTDNRRHFGDVLQNTGAQLQFSNEVFEIQEVLDTSKKINVIIINASLLRGKDFATILTIKQLYPTVAIVILTDVALMHETRLITRCDATASFPFRAGELLTTISSVIKT